MNWGGYPEPCFESGEKKSIILREIISTYLQKDIAGFLKISKLDAYNNLLRLMASQIGNLVNKNEISKTLGLNMETVNKYLNILEGTYVFFLLSPYFTNLRKEISKMQKVYISDPGVRRFILNSALHHTPDSFQGNEIENFVYIHAAQMKGINSINYYRTISKAGIDFILHCRGAMIPLEVKYRKGEQRIPLEIKNFSRRYPDKVNKTLIIKGLSSPGGESLFYPLPGIPVYAVVKHVEIAIRDRQSYLFYKRKKRKKGANQFFNLPYSTNHINFTKRKPKSKPRMVGPPPPREAGPPS